MSPLATVSYAEAAGARVFYREALPTSVAASAPTILLLHGFPSSSHQFRNLMPLLATKGYRTIAPDLPGYGFTTVPDGHKHTFANMAAVVEAFIDAIGVKRFAVYLFDYGAPTGLRLALSVPDRVVAIITQNGNAYEEGLADFWTPIRKYWSSGSKADREALRGLLELEATKWQYTNGNPSADKVQPEAYHLDQALMERAGNKETQLDLFYDYRTNVPLYPDFQKYFRESGVPVLAMWGKNDAIFVYPGAEAYKRDVKKLELRPVDTGHFAIETNEAQFADAIYAFFEKHGVFQ